MLTHTFHITRSTQNKTEQDDSEVKISYSESFERNAWSLIVNYQGEPVTTDIKETDYTLTAPISLSQIGSARPA
jgi:hypothetical protein